MRKILNIKENITNLLIALDMIITNIYKINLKLININRYLSQLQKYKINKNTLIFFKKL